MKNITAATPITKAMELYNWMISYTENYKKVNNKQSIKTIL
jgi:hypothetical protein